MGNQSSKGAGAGVLNGADLSQMYESLLRKANEWQQVPVNFALIGQTGTGKSRFINAIRDLDDCDPRAAKVGELESTLVPTEYEHPDNPLFKMWDLPGVGTPKFPRRAYLQLIDFEKYDFFLLASSLRFNENDIWLAEEIQKRGKRYFFVWTKIDENIARDKERREKRGQIHDPERVLRDVNENIRSNLGHLYDENSVFLINNYNRTMYDFDRLVDRLSDALPEAKRNAFVLSMSAWSESMVKNKITVLRTLTFLPAAASGLVGAAPVPFVSLAADCGMIVAHCHIYFKTLGLDEDSMRRRSASGQRDHVKLEQIVKKARITYLTIHGIAHFIRKVPILVASEVAQQALRWVPGIGSLAAGTISAGSMFVMLNRSLSDLEVIALKVVRADVASSSDTIPGERSGEDGNKN